MKNAILALLASIAMVSPALAQTVTVQGSHTVFAGVSSYTLAAPSNIAVGQIIDIGVDDYAASLPSVTLTDSAGNTCTLVKTTTQASGDYIGSVYRCPITKGSGADTFTIKAASSFNNAAGWIIQLIPPSGYTFGASLDFPAVVGNVTGNLNMSGTASQSNDVLIGWAASSASISGLGSGQTSLGTSPTEGSMASWSQPSASGSVSQSYTTSNGGGSTVGWLLAEKVSAVNKPSVPTAIAYSPASPQLPDTAASGATVAGFTVTTNPSSTYNGTDALLTGSDALCKAPASGNGNLTLSRALTSSDVGSHTCKLQATENGTSFEQDLTFTVVAPPGNLVLDDGTKIAPVIGDVLGVDGASGKFAMEPAATGGPAAIPMIAPLTYAPGVDLASMPSFIAPRAMTVTAILGEVIVPVGTGTASIDVYMAPTGVACGDTAHGSVKLNSGSYNADGPANQAQSVSLGSSLSLPQNSQVCLIESGSDWPGSGKGNIMVVAQ